MTSVELFIEKYPDNHPPLGWKNAAADWKWNIEELSSNIFITPIFIEKHADWKWNVELLSHNPSITSVFIEKYPDHHPPSKWPGEKTDWKWNMLWLSSNPAITPAFIEKHVDWKWNIFELSCNPSITPEFIEKYPGSRVYTTKCNHMINGRTCNNRVLKNADKCKTHKSYISQSSPFTQKNPVWNWDTRALSQNPLISVDFVYKHSDMNWNTIGLSAAIWLTHEFLEKYPDYHPPEKWPGEKEDWEWSMGLLSANPSVFKFVEKHADWKWDMLWLSCNPSITPVFIEKYPDNHPPPGWKNAAADWKWNIDGLSRNPSITYEFILKHSTWDWGVFEMARNPSISPDHIKQYCGDGDNDWVYTVSVMSQNSSISLEFIENHPDWGWDTIELLENCRITPDFVEKHADWGWDINHLSSNIRGNRKLNKLEKICFLIAFTRANQAHEYLMSAIPIINSMTI